MKPLYRPFSAGVGYRSGGLCSARPYAAPQRNHQARAVWGAWENDS